MDEFIDFSGFGASSSESSPLHIPTTPELDASSLDYYQNLLAAAQPQPSLSSTGIDGLKDTSDSWNAFDRLLSPSLFSQSGLSGDHAGSSSLDGMNLFSNQFTTLAESSTSLDGVQNSNSALIGSPPLSASSPSSSSPSVSFALEPQDSSPSTFSSVPTFGHPSFAIDPQLVAAPSPVTSLPRSTPSTSSAAATPSQSISSGSHASGSRTQPPRGSYNEDEDEDDDEEDDDEAELKSVSRGSSIPPAGGRTSAKGVSRRSASGIVQTGGITKQRVTSAVVAIDKDPNDTEDWRPTPEEYKKLSSKEKRQLRNKISARNFRVRRKEYITTLESHIADRDRLIDAIRQELGQSKLENDELRQEVDALKRAMLDGRTTAESLALPPPAPLDANGDVIRPISPPTPQRTSAKLNKPNTRKDIAAPGSPAFWGGVGSFGGGVTPVHATLVPDFTLPGTAPALASMPTTSMASELLSGKMSGWWGRGAEQENLNPLLNMPSLVQQRQQEEEIARINASNNALFGGMSRLDSFMELNPFTIKSADDYRMQLWAQLAASRAQQQYYQAQQQQQTPQDRFAQPTYGTKAAPAQTSTSLLGSARAPSLFFSSPTSTSAPSTPSSPKSTLAALLSGKQPSSSSSSRFTYPTPPTSPRPSAATLNNNTPSPSSQQALVAAMASQTLLSRLGGAFWDAFSGTSSTGTGTGRGASARPNWDADKVRRVLEGKAVLRVVDIDHVDEKQSMMSSGLEEKMGKMSLGACSEVKECGAAACKSSMSVFQNLRK